MNLVVDIGNTMVKYALFNEGEMTLHQAVHDAGVDQITNILSNHSVRAAIVSTVAEDERPIIQVLRNNVFTVVLNDSTPLPIRNLYSTPGTLGSDRLAAVVGASATFPQHNVLVIDAGTCVKYDFIDAAGNYYGGAIAPGLMMRFQAMHNYTDRLPLISAEKIRGEAELQLTGDSTEGSLLSGGAKGLIFEAEGFISSYEKKYPDLRVVCTGGDASFFELHLKRKIFALPDLVLFGLNIILEHNLKQT